MSSLASTNGAGGTVYCAAVAAIMLNAVNREQSCPLCSPSCLRLIGWRRGNGEV